MVKTYQQREGNQDLEKHLLRYIIQSAKKVSYYYFRKHLLNYGYFFFVPPFLRHYIPVFKNKADDLLQNVKFINQKLDAIVKKRRQEIENTPLDKSLPNDMLTSVITANTPRDVNYTKTVGGEAMERPMTDDEIRGIIFDGFLGGTDTVSKIFLIGNRQRI